MTQILLKELAAEAPVAHLLRISNIELRLTKTNKPYIQCKVGDKSTELFCKKWDSSDEEFARLKDAKVVFVKGKVSTFKDSLSVVAESIALPAEDVTEVQITELFPSTKYNVEEISRAVWLRLKAIQIPWLRDLALLLTKEPLVKERIKTAVAAISHHHAYRGGLVTHIFRLSSLCDCVCDWFNNNPYPGSKFKVNKDIVAFGAFCHDLFKLFEYDGMNYAPEGNLLNHLVLGPLFCERNIAKIENFPNELWIQVQHMLFAHHGQVDWGSPITPKTPEAIMLHHLDNLAAKLDPVIEGIDSLAEGVNFTERLKAIDAPAYRGGMLIDQLLAKEKAKEEANEQAKEATAE